MKGSASAARAHQGTVLAPALLKLVELIDEENAILSEHGIANHAGFTDRKNQILREIMAAQRSESPEVTAHGCRDLLERLSAALRQNATLLKLHIEAVGEVSDIIISGLREADSDGTYSRSRRPRG